MNDHDQRDPQPPYVKYIAIGMLGLGILILLVLLNEVVKVFSAPLEHGFIGAVVDYLGRDRFLSFDGRELEIGSGAALVVAYVLLALVAQIAIRIAIGFIEQGGRLLLPDVYTTLERIRRGIDAVAERRSGSSRN